VDVDDTPPISSTVIETIEEVEEIEESTDTEDEKPNFRNVPF
jgi:hypothetical protein